MLTFLSIAFVMANDVTWEWKPYELEKKLYTDQFCWWGGGGGGTNVRYSDAIGEKGIISHPLHHKIFLN